LTRSIISRSRGSNTRGCLKEPMAWPPTFTYDVSDSSKPFLTVKTVSVRRKNAAGTVAPLLPRISPHRGRLMLAEEGGAAA
jgi:hypothetical protein